LREAVGLTRFRDVGPSEKALAQPSASATLHARKLPEFKQYREDGRFYFKLLTGDGRLLLQSDGFAQGRDAGQWVARLRREGRSVLAELPARRSEGVSEQDIADALAQLAAA
jgi:tryptophanyl-tRNA synthetase